MHPRTAETVCKRRPNRSREHTQQCSARVGNTAQSLQAGHGSCAAETPNTGVELFAKAENTSVSAQQRMLCLMMKQRAGGRER